MRNQQRFKLPKDPVFPPRKSLFWTKPCFAVHKNKRILSFSLVSKDSWFFWKQVKSHLFYIFWKTKPRSRRPITYLLHSSRHRTIVNPRYVQVLYASVSRVTLSALIHFAQLQKKPRRHPRMPEAFVSMDHRLWEDSIPHFATALHSRGDVTLRLYAKETFIDVNSRTYIQPSILSRPESVKLLSWILIWGNTLMFP